MIGFLAFCWGFLGVLALLISAIFRLTPITLEIFQSQLTLFQWITLIISVVFMAYSEGFKGFQKNFSPRVVSRSLFLINNSNFKRLIFAPFFCMGYFDAPKKRRIISISVTLGIIAIILIVRNFTQPWRGIIDAGVIIGLSWGSVSMLLLLGKALITNQFHFPNEVE